MMMREPQNLIGYLYIKTASGPAVVWPLRTNCLRSSFGRSRKYLQLVCVLILIYYIIEFREMQVKKKSATLEGVALGQKFSGFKP